MELSHVGITPQRTSDPELARILVEQDGAVVLVRAGLTEADARAVGFSVFNRSLRAVPSGVKVSDVDSRRPRPAGSTNQMPSQCHSSGYSYGEYYPDYVVLLCQWQSEVGGDSVLVDGYALLEALANDPNHADLVEQLRITPIDQTDAGTQPLIRPVVQSTDGGRQTLVMANDQHVRPCADSLDPGADQTMIDRWRAAVDAAAAKVERFKVRNGEALIIDNYRVLHGRDPYEDLRRTLWRVWLWTDQSAHGAPTVPVHSDSRHAAVSIGAVS